ncbi:hypothetical protein Tco_0821005 [Tanacetum coccineum]|uniref:Uncharacterized protein n=1 Tax=Tanacetum coccineum TaxID=301880 RepID=A0ABQ5AF87_9ASTR
MGLWGLVQTEHHVLSQGLIQECLTPDVTVDESIHLSLLPLGSEFLVSLSVLLKSDVMKDSVFSSLTDCPPPSGRFELSGSSVTTAFPFPTTSCSLGVASALEP